MSINLGIIASSRSSAPSAALLLDTYPGAAAAYSLRKLRTAYTGAAIRVRRSSDNTETDIGFDVLGGLDTTALTTFVGAGSGFVRTWYDQSGNARNIVQTTSANQPFIISTGILNLSNSKPSIFFTSNESDKLTTSGIISGNSQRTQIAVYQPTVSSPSSSGIFGQGFNAATGAWSYIQSRTTAGATGDPYFAGYAADLGNGLSTRNTLLKIGTFMYNGTTGYLWKNNTQLTSGNLTLNTQINDITQVGCSGGGTSTSGEFLNGNISECILYLNNQLSNIGGINTNINSFYTIY